MKNRILKMIPLLLLSLAVFVWGLPTTAYAANVVYDPADHIRSISINGDIKTVDCLFSGMQPYTQLYCAGNGYSYFDGAFEFYPTTSVSRIDMQTYPIGIYGFVDVRDIVAGADLTLDCLYSFRITGVDLDSVDTTAVVYLRLDLYDAAFSRIDTTSIRFSPTVSVVDDITARLEFSAIEEFTLLDNVSYIKPWFTAIYQPGDYTPGEFCLTVEPWDFGFTFDMNMVLENSNLMHDIRDEVRDISDKLDDTNDKLDEIISGSPENNAAADQFVEDIGGKTNELDDLVTDMDKLEKPDVNQAVPDIDDVVASDGVLALTGAITPWFENEVFMAYLLVVVILMFGSYVLFGKKV